jgi:hypothetical protein
MEKDIRSGRGLFCTSAQRIAVDYTVSEDDLSPPGTVIIAEIEPTDGSEIHEYEGVLALEDGTQFLITKGTADKWIGAPNVQ